MTIAIIVATDGRAEYIQRAIASAQSNLQTEFSRSIIVNDAGDPGYATWLEQTFPLWECVHHPTRLGMSAATKTFFETALHTSCDYVFRLEDDFVFNEAIDVDFMSLLLSEHRDLAQVSLKRQPVNFEEINAGGFVERDPSAFADANGYIEHTTLFTFNPSLIPQRAIELFIQNEPDNMLERGVTDTLLSAGYKFGIFGKKFDLPRVTHIGNTHSEGYRW